MVIASELKEGTVIRIDGRIYRVLEVESKAGAAKLGGVVKTKLSDVRSGRMWEPHFRPQERLEEVELERRVMEFLFSEGDTCTFMNPDTFEQIEVPAAILGKRISRGGTIFSARSVTSGRVKKRGDLILRHVSTER